VKLGYKFQLEWGSFKFKFPLNGLVQYDVEKLAMFEELKTV